MFEVYLPVESNSKQNTSEIVEENLTGNDAVEVADSGRNLHDAMVTEEPLVLPSQKSLVTTTPYENNNNPPLLEEMKNN